MKIFSELFKGFKKISAACLSGVILVGFTLTSVSCTTEEKIKGENTAGGAFIGALLGAGIAAATGADGEGIAKGALLGGAGGALAGNAKGNKEVENLHAEQRYTDRMAAQLAGDKAYNAKVAAYNKRLKDEIDAIDEEEDAQVALALAKAKRLEVEQNIKSVDITIKSRSAAASAGSSAQQKESDGFILVLKQEKTKLQKAKERLEKIELARRG